MGEINTHQVVAAGIVYVTTDSSLYALDIATGQVKWSALALGHKLTTPAVAEGRLYIGAGTRPGIDAGGAYKVSASAYNAQTGAFLWKEELAQDRSESTSAPVTAEGLVYFGTGWADFSCCESRGNGGHILALDGMTGHLVWQRDTQGDSSTGFAVANGLLSLGEGENAPSPPAKQVRTMNSKTGRDVWHVPAPAAVPFLAPDGTLYAVGERDLYSFNAQTGQMNWRWELDPAKASISRPAIAEATVYVVGNEQRDGCFEGPCPPPRTYTDTLYALDAASGKARWTQEIAGGDSPHAT